MRLGQLCITNCRWYAPIYNTSFIHFSFSLYRLRKSLVIYSHRLASKSRWELRYKIHKCFGWIIMEKPANNSDGTLWQVCAYEKSSLPASIHAQAMEAGLKWFEIQCVSSDMVLISLRTCYFGFFFMCNCNIDMISLGGRVLKGNKRSIMWQYLNVPICKSS